MRSCFATRIFRFRIEMTAIGEFFWPLQFVNVPFLHVHLDIWVKGTDVKTLHVGLLG